MPGSELLTVRRARVSIRQRSMREAYIPVSRAYAAKGLPHAVLAIDFPYTFPIKIEGAVHSALVVACDGDELPALTDLYFCALTEYLPDWSGGMPIYARVRVTQSEQGVRFYAQQTVACSQTPSMPPAHTIVALLNPDKHTPEERVQRLAIDDPDYPS